MIKDIVLTLAAPGLDAFTENEGVYKKELIYVGDFESPQMQFSVDEDMIDHWVASFEKFKEVGVEVPLSLVKEDGDHTMNPEMKRGKLVGMERGVNSRGISCLFGFVEFEKEAEDLAKTADVSIYAPPHFKDGKGNEYQYPIRHVALTNYPVIPKLDGFTSIAASFKEPRKETDMSLKDLAASLKVAVEDNASDEDISKAITLSFGELSKTVEELKEKAKKTEPKPEPQPIPKMFLELAMKDRVRDLDDLVVKGVITPAVKDELTKTFCTDAAIQLSLTDEGKKSDPFGSVVSALSKNEQVISLSEASPLQKGSLEADKNPLIADAERRAAK